jgi:hypothetical protein
MSRIWRPSASLIGLLVCLLLCTGCSGRRGPQLAAAGGVVTYKGQPVDEATVTFSTELGPPAIGRTDSNGAFAFNTRGKSGAVVGPGVVSIIAVKQDRELTEQESSQLAGDRLEALLAKITHHMIPKKYGHPSTSGLTVTVSEDPMKNQFTFDLE